QAAVELHRVVVGDAGLVASLPMLGEVGEELTTPARATFEEGEIELGEAPRHTAEEERLGDSLPGIGKMTDVVERIVARRRAQGEAAAGGMKSRRDAKFAAFLPHGVVVIIAIETELVETHGELRELHARAARGREGTRYAARHHADLEAQLLHD